MFPRVRAEIPETEAKPRPKNQAKGRGRVSRGRHDDDDDDWPSTEWDKLSDEQYWAELSADKPLATTARSAQPSAPAAATPAKPSRATTPPPESGRAPSRPQPAPGAEPTDPGRRRQPADRPGRPARPGSRQGPPRRADGADTDPGRPGLADQPAAAAATERLPGRRPAPESAPAAPAPYLPAAPEVAPARADDDPLTSPHFARGAGGADDSRSYRTPSRNPGPRPDRAGGQAYPSAPNGYPSAAEATRPAIRPPPVAIRPPPAATRPTGETPQVPSPTRAGQPAAADRSAAGTATPVRSATAMPTRPAAMSPIQEHLTAGGAIRAPVAGTAIRPARLAAPTRARHARTWVHRAPTPARHKPTPARGPARAGGAVPLTTRPLTTRPLTRPYPPNRPAAARQAPASPPPSPAASTGYPAAPAPGWGSDRGAAAEAPSAQAGLGNPYGSYVEATPPSGTPAPAPAAPTAPTPAPPPASPYPPGQQAAGGSSYPGYTTGPTAAYSDPYAPGHGSYPATGQPRAADSRAEPGTTWYSAPPAAPPQAPAGAYPYQDPAYPAAAGDPNQGGYPGTPGTRDDTRYRSGQTEDPYHPDGYSGYHPRQG